MKRKVLFIQVARVALGIYVVGLTVLVVGAVTFGPLKEPLQLAAKIRLLESDLRENERTRKSLEEERARLVTAVRKLEAGWAAQQETIRTLKEALKNPQVEARLTEANRLAEQLSQERAVLIAKLNELRQELQAREDKKKAEAESVQNKTKETKVP